MQYKRLLEKIAEQHHTTPAEADKEIKRAIKAAGYDTESTDNEVLVYFVCFHSP